MAAGARYGAALAVLGGSSRSVSSGVGVTWIPVSPSSGGATYSLPGSISKGIAAGFSQNTYRGQVSAHRKATNARNFTNCDSLLIGNQCGAHTVPYIEAKNATAQFEHEATTSKISDDQKFYVMQRGIPEEEAIALIVNGFVKDVIQQLPMEFAVEAQKLIGISLEGSVG